MWLRNWNGATIDIKRIVRHDLRAVGVSMTKRSTTDSSTADIIAQVVDRWVTQRVSQADFSQGALGKYMCVRLEASAPSKAV